MTLTNEQLQAFAETSTVDLTTVGRRSGELRTVEIWWFEIDGRFIITGTPGRRDWLANIRANPDVVLTVGTETVPATAVEVGDVGFKTRVFTDPMVGWYVTQTDLESLVANAPMIEVQFP